MEYTKIPKEYDKTYNAYFDLQALSEKYGYNDGKFRHEYCREHPVVFAFFFLGIKLRKYQAYALDYILKSKNVMWCWSRQLGKSVTLAIFSLWCIIFNKYPCGFDKSTRIIFISHTEDGAKKIIDEINRFIDLGDARYERVTNGKVKNYFSRYRVGINNSFQVTFKRNGIYHFIKSFPPTSRIVGNTGSILIIDECARLKLKVTEDKFFREYCEPTISAYPHAKKIYSSTPEGCSGYFYYHFDPNNLLNEHEFDRIWFPYSVHTDEDYLLMMKEKKRNYERDGKIKEFEQEYLALFVSSEGRYFSPDNHIGKMIDEDMCQLASYSGECYMGIDFGGQRTSHTVITIVTQEKIGDKKIIKRLWHKVYPIKGDNDLLPDIKDLLRRFNVKRIVIDSLGGAYAVPEIKKLKPVTEMVFRRDKGIKYDIFRVRMFRNEIKSYEDEYLLREMYALNNEIKAPLGYTDDAIDSFVIASYHYLEEKAHFNFYQYWGDKSIARERKHNEVKAILSERY